jgi:hypothetical protein
MAVDTDQEVLEALLFADVSVRQVVVVDVPAGVLPRR